MPSQPSILVLTPIKDATECIRTYFSGVTALDYPRDRLSIGLLESDSQDGSYEAFRDALRGVEDQFAATGIWKRDFGVTIPEGRPRWDRSFQATRRKTLARSRNYLLSRALNDQDYVLWLDVDVVEYPTDVLQQLLAANVDIVHPHCVYDYGGPTFDRNAWRDHGKVSMQDLRGEGDLVELHAVGGTMLLVRADLHREGLIFPPFFLGRRVRRARRDNLCHAPSDFLRAWRGDYCGEVETEGLGIMAHQMGYRCFGMPHLEIRHKSD